MLTPDVRNICLKGIVSRFLDTVFTAFLTASVHCILYIPGYIFPLVHHVICHCKVGSNDTLFDEVSLACFGYCQN